MGQTVNTRAKYSQESYFRHLQMATERVLDKERTLELRMLLQDLLRRMQEVEDYRTGTCQFSMAHLLTLIVVGFLMGENYIDGIEEKLQCHRRQVCAWLGISHLELDKIPSDTTLLRAAWNANWVDVLAVVLEWSQANFHDSAGDHMAVDGKANRAALRKVFGGTHPPYLLNSFMVKDSVLQIQLSVGDKTNELGMMPDLFGMLGDMSGITVTIDAAGTHPDIAAQIRSANGHAVLPVKGNQPKLEIAIADFFASTQNEHPERIASYDDKDNGVLKHGRIDERHYWLIHEGVDDLMRGTSFEGIVHSVGLVKRKRNVVHRNEATNEIIPQEPEEQVLYYITTHDASLSVEKFARFVRDHWAGCEMVHYILDVEFEEDWSRIRTGNGMQNVAFLRKAALSMLRHVQRHLCRYVSVHRIRVVLGATVGGVAFYPSLKAQSGTECADNTT